MAICIEKKGYLILVETVGERKKYNLLSFKISEFVSNLKLQVLQQNLKLDRFGGKKEEKSDKLNKFPLSLPEKTRKEFDIIYLSFDKM